MPHVLNVGSCNIDHVLSVPSFVRDGETLSSSGYSKFPGGKGLNQSLALAYAGATVSHCGQIGADGLWLRDLLAGAGVNTDWLFDVDIPTGHAFIQVTPEGENAIVVSGGANLALTAKDFIPVLENQNQGDFLLIQNEISCLPELIDAAYNKELRVIFNAAPMTASINDYPLDEIEMFIVNQVEGEALTGETKPDAILDTMVKRFGGSRTILTLGREGAIYNDANTRIHQPGFEVNAVDTTAAGDTFTGYFVADFIAGVPIEECLAIACRAAAICTTKPGAASSIPRRKELDL